MKTIDRDTGRLGLQQRKGKPGVVYLLAGQREIKMERMYSRLG